jgi:hypothetical protein
MYLCANSAEEEKEASGGVESGCIKSKVRHQNTHAEYRDVPMTLKDHQMQREGNHP